MLKTLAFVLVTTLPAQADEGFLSTANHWTIQSTATGCMAQNRPLSELNEPINALFLFIKPDGSFGLAMTFWPDALKADDNEMTLLIAGQGGFDLAAEATLKPWPTLRTSTPLPPELIGTFDGHSETPLYNMIVAADASGSRTVIDIQDMPIIMTELRRCLAKTYH